LEKLGRGFKSLTHRTENPFALLLLFLFTLLLL